MRLYRQAEVPEDEQALLCRQSRLWGIVRLIVVPGFVAIFPFFGWKLDEPWLLWIGIALTAFVVVGALQELAAIFRPTNWLLRIGSDGMWINLHSYRDRDIVADTPSVVHLSYEEIASVGRHTESYSTRSKPASDAPTEWRDEFLEIELAHDQTTELKAALNDLLFPNASVQSTSPMWLHRRVLPVWYVNPSLIRIAWLSGHGPAIAPPLARVLSRLESYVRVAPPTRRVRPDWTKLTPEEAIELARELVHMHGETAAASAILSRGCGISQGEATAQVRQFAEEAIA